MWRHSWGVYLALLEERRAVMNGLLPGVAEDLSANIGWLSSISTPVGSGDLFSIFAETIPPRRPGARR